MNKSLFNLSVNARSFENEIIFALRVCGSSCSRDWIHDETSLICWLPEVVWVTREQGLVPLMPVGLSEEGRGDGTDGSHQSASLYFLF